MLPFYKTQISSILRSLVIAVALVALLVPQIVHADSLMMLYKEDSGNSSLLRETIRQNTKRPAVVSLNENGDLVVRYGSVNMVLAYNPPEERYKQQETANLTMAMNQDPPSISGISIKVNFTF